jgi:uncharacterized membrane protein YbhN (UPF0104 family)
VRVLRTVVSLSLLGLLAIWLDVGALLDQLRAVEAEWLVAALALSVAQVTISAWRWRYTAKRLGLPLPLGVAVREYYLATFLNQVLPGGVLGDVSRAWRHAQAGAAAPKGVGRGRQAAENHAVRSSLFDACAHGSMPGKH